jgi:hypothetical protein
MEYWISGAMNSRNVATHHHSNTPLLQFWSFLLVPFQHYAVNHSGGCAVILNGVKDLTQAD